MDFPPDQDPGNIRFLPPCCCHSYLFHTHTEKQSFLYHIILLGDFDTILHWFYLFDKSCRRFKCFYCVFCPAGFPLIYVCDGFRILLNSLFQLKFENEM